jgi:hypothetical protein
MTRAVDVLDVLDDSDIEDAIDRARALLWDALEPSCHFTGWRKSDGDEVYCILGEDHDGDHDDGEHDDAEGWKVLSFDALPENADGRP